MAGTLHELGARRAAAGLWRAGQARHPGDFWLHEAFGMALLKGTGDGGKAEAVVHLTAAVALRPDSPGAHYNLGTALEKQGRPKEAEAEYREALRLRPDLPEAHSNLGTALEKQGRPKEAEAEYREALRLRPDDSKAHSNLAIALSAQGRHKEAEAVYREALRLRPDDPDAHYNLGKALRGQGRPKEAEAEYREALRLRPDYPEAHNNLGTALGKQGRYKEAEAAFREALRLRPDDPDAHYNLGKALRGQGRPKEAEAAFREALRLRPDYPEADIKLGDVLQSLGRFAEAAAAFRRGHELGSRQPGWRYPSAAWLRRAERLAALDARLPDLRSGASRPASPAEGLEGAALCQLPCRRLYAATARFFADAFAAEPAAAEDLGKAYRYNAARAAALAGCGKGGDAAALDAKERARLRTQARDWLAADLAAWRKRLDTGKAEDRTLVGRTLDHWQKDEDFAGVRGDEALAKVPELERAAWRKLWADVDALRSQAEKK
jgi:Flp pilus assembly protein TadD